GWIPRSKVDVPDDDEELARNTRRRPFVDGRGTKRGFTGEGGPDDRIGADATGESDDASSKSGKSAARADDDKPSGKRKAARDDDDDVKVKDDGDEADEAKQPTRPMAHVAKATPIYNDPDSSSGASFTAQPKTALYIVEEKGKWTFVENDEGDAGFVLTSKLDVEAAEAGDRTRAIDLRARLGVGQVNQTVA